MWRRVNFSLLKAKKKKITQKEILAQLVEHPFYTRQVKCSNHLFLINYLK